MKIAISSDGDNVESMVDQRFGRCKYFIVVDGEKIEAIENEGAIQGHGAGIKAGQQIGELDVKAVITGDVGPNATSVLEELGIKTYHASGTVKDAIEDFKNNKLEEINEIAQPHSGMVQKESKGERIFFPLLDNNGEDSKISQHFGHAPFFGVYDVEKKELKIIENDLNHTDPTKSPIDQIEEAVNPTTIFAKGIGGRAINLIAEKGMHLKTGDYDTVKEVIGNLDKLDEQTESCGHEH
ncbi:hypothetical protein KY345_06600 [Candidatus Woesearchaeota archaeon]|nr:hypothetical protein [Candidatus Woesearchaeota archaeon]